METASTCKEFLPETYINHQMCYYIIGSIPINIKSRMLTIQYLHSQLHEKKYTINTVISRFCREKQKIKSKAQKKNFGLYEEYPIFSGFSGNLFFVYREVNLRKAFKYVIDKAFYEVSPIVPIFCVIVSEIQSLTLQIQP